jgi:hypothetical protein
MNKKILMIIGGILGLIIVIVGFLLFLNNKNKNTANVATTSTTDTSVVTDPAQKNQIPANGILASQKLRKLSDSTVIAPVLNFDGKAIWFFTSTDDGHLYKVNVTNGLKQEFILPGKVNITDGIWPSVGNDFIVVTGSGAAKSFNYYNSDLKDSPDQKFLTFPQNIREIDFLQDGKHIAYNWVKDSSSSLAIANFDLKNFESIVNLPVPNLTIKVSPNGDRAFLYNDSDHASGKLYYVSFQAKKLITLATSTDNTVIWAGDGKRFLYNRDAGDGTKNNKLWIGNSEVISNKDISLNGSVAKATFDKSGDNVYVAISNGGSDDIWKVSTTTLVKTKVFSAADAGAIRINATNLFLSSDGATLYFKNDDGYLYSVPIK